MARSQTQTDVFFDRLKVEKRFFSAMETSFIAEIEQRGRRYARWTRPVVAVRTVVN
jgi:hypothetical protein